MLWDLREADITLRFRAFELYPDAAESPTSPWTPAERVAIERLSYEAGVVVEEPPFTVRGRKAHEASVFARERGVEIDLRKAMYAAYWRDGSDIGRIEVLCELASNLDLIERNLRAGLLRTRADAHAATYSGGEGTASVHAHRHGPLTTVTVRTNQLRTSKLDIVVRHFLNQLPYQPGDPEREY